MADAASLKIDMRGFLARVIRDGPKAARSAMDRAMIDVGRAFQKQILMTRLRGGTTNSSLGVRTGAGRRSLGVSLGRGALGVNVMHVGFGPPAQPWANKDVARYMHVHETGATIRPRNARHLAIPAEDNKTPAGVGRVRSPRNLQDPVFIPHIFASGLGYLVFEGSALMFLLLKFVRIRARLHFQEDWEAFKPKALDTLRRHLQVKLRDV